MDIVLLYLITLEFDEVICFGSSAHRIKILITGENSFTIAYWKSWFHWTQNVKLRKII